MEGEQLHWGTDPQCTSFFNFDYTCLLGKVFKVTHENGEIQFQGLVGTLEMNHWKNSIFNIFEQVQVVCKSFIFMKLEI